MRCLSKMLTMLPPESFAWARTYSGGTRGAAMQAELPTGSEPDSDLARSSSAGAAESGKRVGADYAQSTSATGLWFACRTNGRTANKYVNPTQYAGPFQSSPIQSLSICLYLGGSQARRLWR